MTIITERDSIGRHLRASRVLAGMDQQHIADAVGVSRTTVSGWERGQFEPTFSQIVRWSRAVGQRLDWFAEGLVGEDVRPEGLEPPTFCMGVQAWTPADDEAFMLFAASVRS